MDSVTTGTISFDQIQIIQAFAVNDHVMGLGADKRIYVWDLVDTRWLLLKVDEKDK